MSKDERSAHYRDMRERFRDLRAISESLADLSRAFRLTCNDSLADKINRLAVGVFEAHMGVSKSLENELRHWEKQVEKEREKCHGARLDELPGKRAK